jgi:hypothetical protein
MNFNIIVISLCYIPYDNVRNLITHLLSITSLTSLVMRQLFDYITFVGDFLLIKNVKLLVYLFFTCGT